MSLIELTPLPGFRWEPGKAARVWFVQPRLKIQTPPPLVSVKHKSDPTGLDLLKATLVEEKNKYDEPGEAPCFILLPEFAIAPSEIDEARKLVADARKNTVVIFGTGQISESKARTIEPSADLWEGPCDGKFTNCAAIGIGSFNQLYLQPKIIPSKWEHGSHWPGKKVRYFEGQAAHFIVLICSELLSQAAGQTTIASVVRELQNNNRVLNEVIWLQHNQFPRSNEFDQSLAALKTYEPQILLSPA